jgi:hypothetical protein
MARVMLGNPAAPRRWAAALVFADLFRLAGFRETPYVLLVGTTDGGMEGHRD